MIVKENQARTMGVVEDVEDDDNDNEKSSSIKVTSVFFSVKFIISTTKNSLA